MSCQLCLQLLNLLSPRRVTSTFYLLNSSPFGIIVQLLYFGHLNTSPSPSPFLSLAPVSTLLISTLVHLVSTAAGCV